MFANLDTKLWYSISERYISDKISNMLLQIEDVLIINRNCELAINNNL